MKGKIKDQRRLNFHMFENYEGTRKHTWHGRRIRERLVKKRGKGGVKEERRESKITNKT